MGKPQGGRARCREMTWGRAKGASRMGDTEDRQFEADKREILGAFRLEIATQLKAYVESQQCHPPCENVQDVSKQIAVLAPKVDLALEGVSNFRKHAARANTYFDKAEAVLEADESRRKKNQRRNGVIGVVLLGISSFLGVKAWDVGWALIGLAKDAPQIHKLTDDWMRYYSTPPDDWTRYYNPAPGTQKPVVPPVPVKPHKSYFAQPHAGVSSNQVPTSEDAGIPFHP